MLTQTGTRADDYETDYIILVGDAYLHEICDDGSCTHIFRPSPDEPETLGWLHLNRWSVYAVFFVMPERFHELVAMAGMSADLIVDVDIEAPFETLPHDEDTPDLHQTRRVTGYSVAGDGKPSG